MTEPLSKLALDLCDEERARVPNEAARAARVLQSLEQILGVPLDDAGSGGNDDGGGDAGQAPGSPAGPPPAAPATGAAGAAPTAGATGAIAGQSIVIGTGKALAALGGALVLGATAGVAADRTLTAPPPAVTLYLPATAAAPQQRVAIPGLAPTILDGLSPDALPTASVPRPLVTAVEVTTSNLAKERDLIDTARTGVARGNPEAALAAVSRHEREYPRGQLREEREALRVLAVNARGGKAEAIVLGRQFRKQYPASVFLPQIDAIVPASP
jgi:hypothetical protein